MCKDFNRKYNGQLKTNKSENYEIEPEILIEILIVARMPRVEVGILGHMMRDRRHSGKSDNAGKMKVSS